MEQTKILFISKIYLYEKNFVNENEDLPTIALKTKEDELVTGGFGNNYIQFWKTKNYINKKRIIDIKCNKYINSIIMINDNTLLIGGDNLDIYIIDTNKYELISHIIKYKKEISAIIILNNGNILMGCNDKYNTYNLFGDNLYSLVEYKYEKGDLIEVR